MAKLVQSVTILEVKDVRKSEAFYRKSLASGHLIGMDEHAASGKLTLPYEG